LAAIKDNVAMAAYKSIPGWTWASPVLAWVVLVIAAFVDAHGALAAVAGAVLIATVFSAVHHAEVVAHRVGEPFGTLILAVAVTVIEVALIVSIMVGSEGKAELARDTVFAAVMIICNGLVGICLLAGGMRHHEQGFQLQGASAALAVLAALTTLTLIVPNYTTTTPGPYFNTSQLIFAGAASLLLYGAFVFVQTVRHRDYFLPVGGGGEEAHAEPPSNRTAIASTLLLIVSLVAIVGLAKVLTPTVEGAIAKVGWPVAFVGVVIAALVLLPEGVAALRAARTNRLQTSLNLALGSALATIGLTIPVIAVLAIALGRPLELGLGMKDQVLLALTLLVGVITLGTGRTTLLQGCIHLVIFGAFLFLAIVP
jgi:Ca2+:H+ antiporter